MTKQSISTILFFFLLVSISSTKLEAEIDSNAFKEIMDDFVEVHKTAAQAVDVGLVLADVKVTLEASEKKYSEFIKAFVLSCESAKAKLTAFIKSLTNAKNSAQNDVTNTWTAQETKATKGLKETRANIATTKTRLADVHSRMTKIIIDYHEGVTETDSKLHVVKELRDIIEDELVNPGKAFVQISKFNEKLNNLQELIKKSGDNMYTPIIETLVQLASEGNFSDQRILQSILKNLHDLEVNLQKFKTEREHDMKVNMKNHRAQEENLTSQLGDYMHLEQKYLSDIAEAHQNISVLNTEILNLNTEITTKNEEAHNIAHLCNTENDMFKSGTQRINLIKHDLNAAVNSNMNLHK
jgi:hypothetical protein